LLPSLALITQTLKSKGTDAWFRSRRFSEHSPLPPFGVRKDFSRSSSLSILQRTASASRYEDGTYLHEVGGDVFLRIMKEPQFFHLNTAS
jgi:hypothetical protein